MEINKDLNRLGAMLLAKSVTDLYTDAQLADYQIYEDGFKYNIEFTSSFSINELNKLKKQMLKNIDRAYEIKYELVSKTEAISLFKINEFKKELIKESNGNEIGLIKLGNDFIDLCEKLDYKKMSVIKAIALTNVAGAY
jgi:threonyl-tRNA synthetase